MTKIPAQLSYARRADGANRRPQAANIDFSGDDDIDDDDDGTGLDIFNCNTLTEILQYVGIFVSTLRTLLSGTKKSQ